MDERLQFVARRLADGGTLQGVRHFAQDRLQDLRSLPGMWGARTHRQEPTSLSCTERTNLDSMNTSRCLGLVGGLGVGATIHYYEKLAKAV